MDWFPACLCLNSHGLRTSSVAGRAGTWWPSGWWDAQPAPSAAQGSGPSSSAHAGGIAWALSWDLLRSHPTLNPKVKPRGLKTQSCSMPGVMIYQGRLRWTGVTALVTAILSLLQTTLTSLRQSGRVLVMFVEHTLLGQPIQLEEREKLLRIQNASASAEVHVHPSVTCVSPITRAQTCFTQRCLSESQMLCPGWSPEPLQEPPPQDRQVPPRGKERVFTPCSSHLLR